MPTIPALTLTQPWASLVALGVKRIETRSWRTSYRGPLAIHAAKGFPKWAKETCERPGIIGETLRHARLTPATLPKGAVLCVCRLVEIFPTAPSIHFELSNREYQLGDYTPGRFAWILEDIEPLPEAMPAVGSLQLWDWEGTR